MLSMHTKHDGVVFADVSLSTMERPHSGPTAVVIAVQPVPGKYAWNRLSGPQFPGTLCPGRCDVICTRLASPQMVKLQQSYPAGPTSAPATAPTPGAMPARIHIGPQKNITLMLSRKVLPRL